MQSPSFGLVCKSPKVLFTTDMQYTPNLLLGRYKEAYTIFHDCETAYSSGVHPFIEDFNTFPLEQRYKVNFVHFNDNVIDDWDVWNKQVKDKGFEGFVARGSVFNL